MFGWERMYVDPELQKHWQKAADTEVLEDNYALEKALKGDFIDSLPRYPLGSIEGGKSLDSSKPSVAIEDCDFSVSTDKSVLEDISFSAQDGELVAVVGRTGAGKSSLLLSICGEIEKTKGTGAVFGTIAYMEQKPIIIDETVRDNILFGRKYDKEHYNRVIEACALTEDINAWKKGDKTVIGERGIKVSGGQRARLALARTIYSKADIYVLDDPLSSVDAHVKRHILDNVIMDSGLLGGTLRILTVNSEKLLPYFNQVIRLDEGKAVVTKQVPQTYQPLTTDFNHAKISVNDMSNTGLTNATETAESNQQMAVTEHPDDTEADSESEPDNSFGSKNVIQPDIRQWGKWSNIKYIVDICGIPSLMLVAMAGFISPIFSFVMDGYRLDILNSNTNNSNAKAYSDLAETVVDNVTGATQLPKQIREFNEGIDVFRHYMDMERDDGSDADTVEPPSNWPSSGKIELRNFSMKYHEDLEYVLKDISLTINSGEKIGIVGRTGAGKTSLSRAIFRLVNKKTCEGSILIDGYNISTINPSNLRPKLGTIPQESTMFTGSFKQNLDPLVEYTIEDMWGALIKCNMVELVEPKRDQTKDRSSSSYSDNDERVKKQIADWNKEWQKSSWMKRIFLWIFVTKPELPDRINEKAIYGLDRSIDDYNRFSNGQKQLFSLCRLLMRKHKIIVLDEATADVDLETDKEMQKLFRSEFKNSTVLTIAHRLETIMNSDRIIVMDKGRVVEFGPPKDLIDQGGYFSELVKAN
ncbi:ABC transporter C member 13, partial [Coemansia sp. Benny D160-2]